MTTRWFELTGWKPPVEADAVLDFYASLVRPTLDAQTRHRGSREVDRAARYLLDRLVWGVTTMTDGPGHARWNTRYVSAAARTIYGAFEEAARRGQLTALKRKHMRGLRHEHVFPRRVMVDRLLAGDTVALTESFGCVVTVAEHGILDDRCSGSDRYREAGVRVWDRAGVGAWLDW